MQTEIKFEPSGRDGLVAVGTYLSDAAKRLGLDLQCEGEEGVAEKCVVKITGGAELLSPVTKAELEYLSDERRSHGERLADHAKIEKEGEITVMAEEKKRVEPTVEEQKEKDARKEFEELPLEKKVAQLLEMEMVTLSETVSFVFNSPFKIVDKVMDVKAEFGLKMDKNAKAAKRPDEHKKSTEKDAPATAATSEPAGDAV